MRTVPKMIVGAAIAGVLTGGVMVLMDQWTVYAHEYAHVGIKFAPEMSGGCGLELPTQLGRDAGLVPFYCDEQNSWDFLPESWYTSYEGV